MLWLATLRALVAKLAVRVLPVPDSVPVPRVVVPSLKVMVPEGVTPVTVAVKVTAAPVVEGFRLEASVVVLADLVDVTVLAVEVLVLLTASAPYTAVRLLLATVVKVAEYVAVRVLPVPDRVPVPIVAVPAAAVMVAALFVHPLWLPTAALAALSFFLFGAGPIIWTITSVTLRQTGFGAGGIWATGQINSKIAMKIWFAGRARNRRRASGSLSLTLCA